MVSRSCTYLRSVCRSSITTWCPGYSCELDANISEGSESLESFGEQSGGESIAFALLCCDLWSRGEAVTRWLWLWLLDARAFLGWRGRDWFRLGLAFGRW